MNQRTSQGATVDPSVSAGLARTIGQMTEAAALKWNGGTAKMELVKGDPEFQEMLFKLWDERSAKRAELLAWQDRPVWKTVTVGTHQSKKDLQKATENEGHKFSDWAKDLFNQKKFPLSTEQKTVELFTCTVAELGFPNGGNVQDIYAKLDSFGFGVCPHETAVQLRRVYKDQPMNEWRIVITEPVADSFGCLTVLSVGRLSFGSWVRWLYAYPDNHWFADDRLVFCRK